MIISGVTPTSEIDLPDGKKYFDTVNLIAPLFFNGMIDWTDPFPYVLLPSNTALFWSCSAPATISEAEADPLLINTIKGLPLIRSPFFAKNFLFSSFLLPLVETISPSSRKKSEILIAWDKSPPGLFLRSKI